MKKKYFLSLCLVLVFSLFLFGFRGAGFAVAEEPPTEQEFSITFSAEDGFKIDDTETRTTWNDALSYIKEQTTAENIAKLNFASVSGVSECLELSGADFILTGSITSSSSDSIIKISSANKITLDNLALTGTCDTAVEVTSEEAVTISISNLTVGGTKRVMSFSKPDNTVNFAGPVTLSSPEETIFSEFESGLNFNVVAEMTGSSKLKLVIPYTAENLPVITYNEDAYNPDPSAECFVPVSKNEKLYTINLIYTNFSPVTMLVTSNIQFTYDTNGGEITAEEYESSFTYSSSFEFLKYQDVNLDYHELDGWFGKYTLSEDEKLALDGKIDVVPDHLYFDINSLKAYIDAGKPAENMLDYFSTSVDDIKDVTGRIKSHNGSTDENFVKFMLESDKEIILTAKWIKKLYILKFNSVGGSNVDDMVRRFGETITAPDNPQKPGYTFDGWFEDEDYDVEFHFNTMPSENKTLYARWKPNNHKITYHLNGAEYEGSTDTYEYHADFGTPLSLPQLSKVGYNFRGWFREELFQNEFALDSMPDEDLDLYAYFEIIKFTVFFENTNISSKSVNYGEKVDKPNNPERPGFIFIGWYEEDSTSSNEFDFDNTEIYADTHIYAVWRQAQYHYQIVMGFTGADIPPQDLAPGTTLTEPNIPTRPNYNFVGWFADANFETPFVFPNEMPFSDLTIYACWQAKQNIVLDLKSQEYDFDPFGVSYKSFSDLDGFMVWYFVDGAWTTDSPQRVGTYDVRISRAEDSVYASYEFILEDGLIINYAEKDISIYIVLLFILFGLEIFAIIVLKIMKARKVSKVYAFLPVVISESTIIPNSQFIIMLIACGLVVIGFGYLIYLIVDVHNTAKNESFLPSNLDNRERFKDDLEFQLKNQGDADFETKTKTDETFGEKYSATDIARLLRNDTFKEETLARRKFNVEDNSSTNWNEVSTNKGSDIIAKSKDMKDLVNGKYDSHTPVMFFDEDSDDTASGTTAHNGDAANTSSDSNVKSFENDANGSFAGSEVPADDFSDDDAEK